MLHSISEPRNPEESRYYLSPRKFHRFMRWFRIAGCKTVTTRQWIDDKVPADHVLLTFDDGYDDLYTELFPFLIENRLTALIFLVANQIGTSNAWDQKSGLRARKLLTLDQIREMQRYGVEFGSHTLTHPYLPDTSDQMLHCEVADSKQRLEDLLGAEVNSFAYPSGGVDRRVRSAVANAGYKAAFTILPGPNWWNDPLCQRRSEINDYTSIVDFAWKLRTGLGLTESLGSRLRSLQNSLPTSFLRNAAENLGRLGHNTVQHLSRESRERKRT
jgi:peptidoglycan/xylan/chitin deacetylase (PgdA/CDA1 family)